MLVPLNVFGHHGARQFHARHSQPLKSKWLDWTCAPVTSYAAMMAVIATIMNTATGRPIQKMRFERMPKPWSSFNLENGDLVTAERIDIGKPAPGKFVAPVDVWVTIKPGT